MGDIHFLNEPGPDVVIQRDTFPPDSEHPDPWTFVRANVPRTVVWHSPEGFEFGFSGSGPADLALNVLQAFLPGRDVDCFAGTKCSRAAARLHQDFKEQFLARIPDGTFRIEFTAAEIKAWIEVSLPREFKPEAGQDVKIESLDEFEGEIEKFDPAKFNAMATIQNDQYSECQIGAEFVPPPITAARVLEDVEGALSLIVNSISRGRIIEAEAATRVVIRLIHSAREAAVHDHDKHMEDLRAITRMTGDFVRLVGHRVGTEDRIVTPNPMKAVTVLKKLDVILTRLESELGLEPVAPG